MQEPVEDDLWVFGYGSLIWRPDFPFTKSKVGFISGWARRFYQGSTDHRGVPGSPGRVVTLVSQPEKCCWGMAFMVEGEQQQTVLKALDHREKGGYRQRWLPFYSKDRPDEAATQVLTYFAGPDNPNYLGPAPMVEMAQQILHAEGPSGRNAHYLFSLESALTGLGISDHHVASLSSLVRSIQHGGVAAARLEGENN